MPTKAQLRAHALLNRPYTRFKSPDTGRTSLQPTDVDKTPMMLYTEQTIGQPIRDILLKQMSNRRLADWVTVQIGRAISYETIYTWRKRFNIVRKARQ